MRGDRRRPIREAKPKAQRERMVSPALLHPRGAKAGLAMYATAG